MKLIRKYLLAEILGPFLGGIGILTFVLVMFQILRLVDMVIVQGVAVKDVGLLLVYLLPPFLSYTIPIAFLLGVILAFGRLSADSEIIAMRATGRSLYQLLLPVLGLAIAVGILGALLTHRVEPAGKRRLRELLWEVAQSKITVGVKEGTFNDAFKDSLLYTNKIDPKNNRLLGILVYQGTGSSQIILAKVGQFEHSKKGIPSLVLELGSIHPAQSRDVEYHTAHFKKYLVSLELEKTKKVSMFPQYLELSTSGLKNYLDENKKDIKTEEYRRAWAEYHRRFSFPFAGLLFAFIGLALGLAPPRSGRARGVTYSFVVIAGYYTLFRVAESLSWRAVLNPALAMWLPNMVIGTLGLVYFVCQARK